MSAKLTEEDKCHLATGYLPSVEEANAIRTRNMKRGKLIRGINKEIATLRARRRRLIAASTIGKAIMAPIRKIPVEILAEILFQCIPLFTPDLMHEKEHLHPQNVCKLIGSVCREWRTIVNETPRLWSSLFINCGTRAVEDLYPLLKKSKSHPLEILIDSWSQSSVRPMPGLSTDVIAMLRGEMWRIRTLIAHMRREGGFFPPGSSLHAPLMQSFTHSSVEDHDMDLGEVYCPELRSVTLCRSDNIVRVLTANPMQSVRHLQISSEAPPALHLQFLNSLPHLVSLRFGHFGAEQPLEAPLAVALHSLKSLCVDAPKSTAQLLPHLHTPALESFVLFCSNGFETPSMEEIIEIICRGGVVKLRRLHLIQGTFRTLVPMMLCKLDHLDTLIISKALMSGHLLTALKVPDQDFGILCPKLTTLVMIDTEVPQDPFDEFVHSRMLADSEEPAPGFVTCLKLHGRTREFYGDHHFQRCSQTHSATIHITYDADPDLDPSEEYFPPTMWAEHN